MTVKVWSEFPGRRSGGWVIVDQCSECSYLMGLIHGGVTKFPKGAYTTTERDAFTAAETNRAAARAANKAMFPLLDAASVKRYGKRLRPVSGSYTRRSTAAQVQKALSTPGNAVALPGNFVGLGFNHPLRARARQANRSDYLDGHMGVFVNTGGKLGFLDPLRPNGEGAYPCTVADAMNFANGGPFSAEGSDAHVVRLNEFATLPDTATEDDMINPDRYRPVASAVFKGGTVYKDPDRKARYPNPLAGPVRLEVLALPRVTRLPDGRSALVPAVIDTKGGPTVDNAIGWIGFDQLDQKTWQPIGWST